VLISLLAVIDPLSIAGILAALGLVGAKAARDKRAGDTSRLLHDLEGLPVGRLGPVRPDPHVRIIDFGTFPVVRWLQQRGWEHENGVYRGQFNARGKRICGEVHYRGGEYELLLHAPPSWATQGQHSACWRERPGGWRLLHLNSSPANVVEAIVGCQAFLERKQRENGR
jgi:hypothetical protein